MRTFDHDKKYWNLRNTFTINQQTAQYGFMYIFNEKGFGYKLNKMKYP